MRKILTLAVLRPGRTDAHESASCPGGTSDNSPAFKRWAIFKCASGTGHGEFKTERGRLVRANPSTGTRGRGVRAPSYGYLESAVGTGGFGNSALALFAAVLMLAPAARAQVRPYIGFVYPAGG